MIEQRHGAVVTQSEDRHARKRRALEDAQVALDRIQEEKAGRIAELQGLATLAAERSVAEAARLAALTDLRESYLDLASQYQQLAANVAEQIDHQRLVATSARAEAERATAIAVKANKPFRKREVPLERRIDSLTKRLKCAAQ